MARQTTVNLSVSQSANGFTVSGGDNQKSLTVQDGDVTLVGGSGYTYTFPSADATIVGTAGAQTLTDKTVSGSFSGSGANLFGVVYANLSSIPGGIVSSSGQVTVLLPEGTVSSSAQITEGLPSGVVSSSGQVDYTGLSNIPGGIVSSSSQVATLLPEGTVSSSAQVDYTSLQNIPGGIVSSSGQVDGASIQNNTVNFGGVSVALGSSDTTPAFDLQDATNYPFSSLTGAGGLVSSSGQIDYTGLSNIPGGIVSSSGQVATLLPEGTVSSSAQVDYTGLTNIPGGIVSSSGQVDGASIQNNTVGFGGVSVALGSTDATPAFDLQDATNYPFSALTGAGGLVSSSGQIDYTGLSNIPGGIISSSGQVDGASITNNTVGFGGVSVALGSTDATPAFDLQDATNYPYASLTSIPGGIVSSSAQVKSNLPEGTVSSSTQQVVSSYTNATDNRVITSTGAGGINGESTLTFDGSLLTVTGDLTVTQKGTFDEVWTNYITSSVGYLSGSTRFGDHPAASTTHEFTGSMLITGSTPTVNGTAVSLDGHTHAYSSLTSIPGGIVSSSVQVKSLLPEGSVSSSAQVDLSAATGTAVSASYAITASYSLNAGDSLPEGLISSSDQIDFWDEGVNDFAIRGGTAGSPESSSLLVSGAVEMHGGSGGYTYTMPGATTTLVGTDTTQTLTNKTVSGSFSGSFSGALQGNLTATTADGPTILDESATGTNPTLVPDRSDATTGVGATGAGLLDLIAGGTQAMQMSSTQITTVLPLYASNAAGPGFLNEAATSTNPTLVPNRADLTTGIGWYATSHIAIIANGTAAMSFFAGAENKTYLNIVASNAAGPAFQDEAATSTNPTLVPNRADASTGIGWQNTGHVSLISQGTEILRAEDVGTNFTKPFIGVYSTPSSATALKIATSGFTGTTQVGIQTAPSFGSQGTTAMFGNEIYVQTQNTTYTTTDVAGLKIRTPTKGALHTITNLYGLLIEGHTDGGSTNYAIHTSEGIVHFGDDVEVIGEVSASIFSGSYYGDGSNLTGVGSDLPEGVVSSSGQIDHDQTTNFEPGEHFTQANITTVGTVTAGDVSAILPSGIISSSAQQVVSSYTNATDDRVMTSTGAGGINGESNLTFDGTTLTVAGSGGVSVSGGNLAVTGGNIVATNAITGSSTTTWRVRIPVGTNLYD